MKILFINSVCGIKSTGRICTDLASKFISEGHEVRIAYGREVCPTEFRNISYRIGNDFLVNINGLKTRLFDNEGFNARRETKKFIKWAEKYNPDLLWLHNLHGYYINLEILFNWIKSRPNMEVRWTLHDCWAFTGHCTHFSYVKCYKWKKECSNCIQKREYPRSFLFDCSEKNFKKKKNLFCGIKNMIIITPSIWLKKLVTQSFLKEYSVDVNYNTIDTETFKPTKSNFRKRYNLDDKLIILGVASNWSDRKGLSDFVYIANKLPNDCCIILVGVSKRIIKKLPKRIIGIAHTNSKQELAQIYSAADIFVNPSREETFGLTTVEAICCGTPAIVYKGTACEEIANMYGGKVVHDNPQSIVEAISLERL